MKFYFKLFSTAVLFLSFHLLFAQESNDKIKWMSFEEAVEKQKKEPRKIFVDVYTNWCGWCKRMDAGTFSHAEIAKYVNKKYYAVKLNAETRDTIKFKGKDFMFVPQYRSNELAVTLLQGSMSYPSFVFMNEKMEILTVLKGYQQVPQFDTVLKYFGENNQNKTKWEDFQRNYKSTFN